MSRVIRFKFGASVFGLMETSKKHGDSLAIYLKKIVQ
jgi:short subunit fatty acids transporter